MNVVHGRDHAGDLRVECDVAVVGTGAGASVIAKHMAEAGHDVAMFEEGGHIRADEMARMRPSETMRHGWRETGLTATIPLGDSPLINVMMGRCVGGSSVMTGGVCFRIPEKVLHEWRSEHALGEYSSAALEPCYADVERFVHVEEVPPEMR
jgi:choline dehydrogenase-like flavoprotein